jgi:hypothetical protein
MGNCLGMSEESHENLNHDSRCPSRDSNRMPVYSVTARPPSFISLETKKCKGKAISVTGREGS